MKLKLTTTINASPAEVYEAWLNSELHSEMTGGEANVSDQVGDSFDAWDGYISGSNIELEKNKHILQKWRTTEFTEEEEDSIIEIQFAPVGSDTEITLIHSNLPEHGEQYRSGWEEHYFVPMKSYFEK
jgi:activator of HSP90 ATPase